MGGIDIKNVQETDMQINNAGRICMSVVCVAATCIRK